MSRLSLAVLVVFTVGVAAIAVPGTAALLTDEGTSTGDASAGSIDITLSEAGPATHDSTTDETDEHAVRRTWADADHATGGGSSVSNTLSITLTGGSLTVSAMNLTVATAENDSDLGTPGNGVASAKSLRVDRFVYDGVDLVGTELVDENGNGKVDVHDLMLGDTADNLSSLSPPAPGDSVSLTVEFSGNADVLAGVGAGDGLDIELTVAAEHRSFRDEDVSSDNTITYD